ncbi:MAG: fimbrial protein, partial [Citrobacter sp.]
DANINVTLTGTQNPDTTDDSVLELSNQGDDKVAAGIGVQLLYNDTPLELNKMLNLKRSAGGQEPFPITARYIQTKDKVRAGQANATATLNLTYQ